MDQFCRFKPARNAGGTTYNESVPASASGQSSSSFVGQCVYSSEHKFSRGFKPDPFYNCAHDLAGSLPKQNNFKCKIFSRPTQSASRPFVQAFSQFRLDTKPVSFPISGSSLGPTHYGQVCVHGESSNSRLQQSILRPSYIRNRLPCTTRLGMSQQLCEPSILHNWTNLKSNSATRCYRDNNRSALEVKNLVPSFEKSVGMSTTQTSKFATDISQSRSSSRTKKEPPLENFCVESLWKTRVIQLGWSDKAATRLPLSLAKSTLAQYNRCINQFKEFCSDRQCCFPPDSSDHMYISAVIADFLCDIADKSDRPESPLKMASAAISLLYRCLGLQSPMDDMDINRLITALVKSGTKRPAKRTPVMPITPFMRYFDNSPDNSELPLKLLRLKAITLLALVFMSRPSDMAPKSQVFDPMTETVSNQRFLRKNVEFHEDGSMSVTFFGVKNDTSRSGFEIRIPPSANQKTDPVHTLKYYLDRTSHMVPEDGPVFVSLTSPYIGISSQTVSKILVNAIDLVGLGGKGFQAKCFRPTAANAAIQSGCDPESTMYIGRWKTKDVFFNHYVFPMAPQTYTNNILKFSGLSYTD